VRVTGSSKKGSLSAANDAAATSLNEAGYGLDAKHAEAAPEFPEFEDATDAQLSGPERESMAPANAQGEATLFVATLAVATHEEELASLGAPPTSRSRVRQHAGRFEAARAADEAAMVVRSDRAPVSSPIQTVSLRRTLAPVVVGLLAIVLVVLGVTSGAEDASVAGSVAAGSTEVAPTLASSPLEPLPAKAEEPLRAPDLEQGKETPSLEVASASTSDLVAGGMPGTLNVQSEPPAKVFIGGKSRGRTPLRGLRLPAGEYRMRLESPTQGKRFKTVRIFPQQLTTVNVRFEDSTPATAVASVAVPTSPLPSGERAPGKPRETAVPPATRNCSPRWLVDAQGVRRVKPECLLD
jgi:hypothetical protein